MSDYALATLAAFGFACTAGGYARRAGERWWSVCFYVSAAFWLIAFAGAVA